MQAAKLSYTTAAREIIMCHMDPSAPDLDRETVSKAVGATLYHIDVLATAWYKIETTNVPATIPVI